MILNVLLIFIFSLNKKDYFFEWICLNFSSIHFKLRFYLNNYSLYFFLTVIIISLSIYLYRIIYIENEQYFFRFIIIKSLFILSIALFIFRRNFIAILLGWDGLGITSYLLVIYYNNSNSLNAGILTLLTNRLGDLGIIFLLIIFLNFRDWEFNFWIWKRNYNFFWRILLFLTISTKRAQIPFSSWLPAAIAAPTPISSLVHSSTLVTAGVYLLLRFSFEPNYYFYFFRFITALIANFRAFLEPDIKKVVALSTLRHLRIMCLIIRKNFLNLAYRHLLFHAYFKALLFITIGISIHLFKDYQDSLKIRHLNSMDLTNRFFITLSLFSLCGLPYLTGFYSKDFFFEISINSNFRTVEFFFIILIGLLSIFYSLRFFIYLILFNLKNYHILKWKYKFLNPFLSRKILLLILSIIMGKFLRRNLIIRFNIIFFELFRKIFITLFLLRIIMIFFLLRNLKIQSFKTFFLLFKKIAYLQNFSNLFNKYWLLKKNKFIFIEKRKIFNPFQNLIFIFNKLNFFNFLLIKKNFSILNIIIIFFFLFIVFFF